jgi:phosphoenolpyruvate carboxylase
VLWLTSTASYDRRYWGATPWIWSIWTRSRVELEGTATKSRLGANALLATSVLVLITGDRQRLANNEALQRSIRYRSPYIDSLHHLQVELVRRYRAGQAGQRMQRGIHISINGTAAGLRNTG